MLQDDVFVELNCCFNAQCLMRQRVRETCWTGKLRLWSDSVSKSGKRPPRPATTLIEAVLDNEYRGREKTFTRSLSPPVVLAV